MQNAPVFMAARFLNGLSSNMNTIPMLNTWTPPPDMYNMNACMGRDFAGEMARSHARLSFRVSYEALTEAEAFAGALDFDCSVRVVRGCHSGRIGCRRTTAAEKPGGGGRFFHLSAVS